jgi:hypothetical protein
MTVEDMIQQANSNILRNHLIDDETYQTTHNNYYDLLTDNRSDTQLNNALEFYSEYEEEII